MGKRINLYLFLVFQTLLFNELAAQKSMGYFQQEIDYRIDVILDDINHKLIGKEIVHYHNHSPDTLSFIYFHLYPNAYRNRNTALAKQFVRNNESKFHFTADSNRGWIDSLNFSDELGKLVWEYHPEHGDICKVILRKPLLPGQSTRVITPFVVKIPGDFSRLGHVGQSYQISQWYPKPAVYDQNGWNAMPYLNLGEFYSDFGSFEVSIRLPATYRVAATGVLQQQEELDWLEVLSKEAGYPSEENILEADRDRLNKTKTIVFKQDKVHDFAFFCSKSFVVRKDIATLQSGKTVDCWAFFEPKTETPWTRGAFYVKRAVEFYSEIVGDYPYQSASAVQGALSAGGGMEYPMVTVVSAGTNAVQLDNIITHEVGHNWFYGILASNEREYAWLDEGFNSYLEIRYMNRYYQRNWLQGLSIEINKKSRFTSDFAVYLMANLHASYGYQFPINTSSELLPSMQYGLLSYQRTAFLLAYLHDYLGEEVFDACLKRYFMDWGFKHPGPEDVKAVFEEKSGKKLDWFFNELFNTDKQFDYRISQLRQSENTFQFKIRNKGEIAAPFAVHLYQKDTIVASQWYDGHVGVKTVEFPMQNGDALVVDGLYRSSDFNVRNNRLRTKGLIKSWEPIQLGLITGFGEYSRKNLYLLPAVGYNTADGWMLGAGLHNYDVLGKRFNYLLMPMYGFHSNTLSGLFILKHDWFVRGSFLKKVRLMGEYKRFADYDKFEPSLALFYQTGRIRQSKYWVGLSHAFIYNRNNAFMTLPGEYQLTRLRSFQHRKTALLNEDISASVMLISATGLKALRTEVTYERNDRIYKKGRINSRVYLGASLNDGLNNYFSLYSSGSTDIAKDYYSIDRVGNGRSGWMGTNQALFDQGGFASANLMATKYLMSANIDYSFYQFLQVFAHGLILDGTPYYETGVGISSSLISLYIPLASNVFAEGVPANSREWTGSMRFVLKYNFATPLNSIELF